MLLRLLVFYACLGGLAAVEPLLIQVPMDGSVLSLTVPEQGVILRADGPATATGRVTFPPLLHDGLAATFFARSLRNVIADDWRQRKDSAGSRHDALIDFGSSLGTAAERARFGIGGSDGNWDNISVQWDGFLDIPQTDTELATASDDGSRVWLDRNKDGQVSANEWGDNGWGGGQGTTTRTVHTGMPAGRYAIRVQYEDGDGGNACRLLWRSAGLVWTTVPASAFQPVSTLTVEGPLTLDATVVGDGEVIASAGVRLSGRIAVRRLHIAGTVTLAGDLEVHESHLRFHRDDASLGLAGHVVTIGTADGAGGIDLQGGTVITRTDTLDCTLRGPGRLQPQTPQLTVDILDDSITILGETFVVRSRDSVAARIHAPATLTRTIPFAGSQRGAFAVEVDLLVPDDAPKDLGLGLYRCDRHGRWFQALAPGPLSPGKHTIRLDLDAASALTPEQQSGRWTAAMLAEQDRLGLVLFGSQEKGSQENSSPIRSTILLRARRVNARPTITPALQLTDFQLDGFTGTAAHAVAGQRWQLRVRPSPYPENPFDPEQFRLDLTVTEPDGTQRIFAGFHDQDMEREDRGDGEIFRAVGTPHFSVRFRPRVPGPHQLSLTMMSASGKSVRALPDLVVSGAATDPILRPDAGDPRFFSANGQWVWPLGHNLHSTYDTRGAGAVRSRQNVDRGSFTREALLRRLAAAGGTGCETWLSAWNLGLEWDPAWPGYHGTGRYHAGHAWAIDQFLDLAEELGVSVNVSIFNHGMARDGDDAEMEWPFHPWSQRNGGWLTGPPGLFTDDRAFAAQMRLFRYLTARYSDSPALLGWKLWAEVDLAHAPKSSIAAWHAKASVALRDLDPYGRAVTTHWCGDWSHADPAICILPGIGYLTIDAYHGPETPLADLLARSTRDPLAPSQGLAGYGKPVWVTEFGGDAFGASEVRLRAEHALGPWVGLVTGHAASPLLWWFEWIDQGEHYGVYHALSAFIRGEDPRHPDAESVALLVQAGGQRGWCRAWRHGDRWLGYILDPMWGLLGEGEQPWLNAILRLTDAGTAPLIIQWWDADAGTILGQEIIQPQAGFALIKIPTFARHIAFKVWRE